MSGSYNSYMRSSKRPISKYNQSKDRLISLFGNVKGAPPNARRDSARGAPVVNKNNYYGKKETINAINQALQDNYKPKSTDLVNFLKKEQSQLRDKTPQKITPLKNVGITSESQ